MTATLDVQFTGAQAVAGDPAASAVSTAVNAAFSAWLSHFDYTTGNYTINVAFGSSVADVTLSGDTYVRVGTFTGNGSTRTPSGSPLVSTLFGLDVAARNGVSPSTLALTLTINPGFYGNVANLTGPLEREFEHALGVRSSRGTAPPQPVPAGTASVFDQGIIGSEAGLQNRLQTIPLVYTGPNVVVAYQPQFSSGTLLPLSLSDGSTTATTSGQTVNTSFTGTAASQLQPLDVAMLRDAGLPVLTDQEALEHQIARIYFAAYGRVATGAELTASTRYYQAALAAGGSTGPAILATIGAALASGSEFASRYGPLSDADFVRVAYQNTFGRTVDNQSLSAITQYLAGTGTPGRGAVLSSLTDTDEARGRLSANANVTYAGTVEAQTARLYDTAFGRPADPGGYAQYTRALINGFTLKQAAASFLQSSEFAAHYGASPFDQALVDGLYQNTLGRAPDAAGEAQYLQALASGMFDRADLVVAFSESGEHIGLMAQRAGARDAAGLFVNTQPQLGIIPVLNGSTPYGSVSG